MNTESLKKMIELRLSGRIAKIKSLEGFKGSKVFRAKQRGYIEALIDLAHCARIEKEIDWRESEWA